ncbi:unnamed protein product [Urochloa humidicola]
MSHGVDTHPSLCPPLHGDPPNKVPWVLLDLHAYVADRENATSAYSEMSNGKAIRATISARRPRRSSPTSASGALTCDRPIWPWSPP